MATKRKLLKSLAAKAFAEQSGCCIYCDKPMWLDDPAQFSQRCHLTPKQAQLLQCTGEHLFRHSAGGQACPTAHQSRKSDRFTTWTLLTKNWH